MYTFVEFIYSIRELILVERFILNFEVSFNANAYLSDSKRAFYKVYTSHMFIQLDKHSKTCLFMCMCACVKQHTHTHTQD